MEEVERKCTMEVDSGAVLIALRMALSRRNTMYQAHYRLPNVGVTFQVYKGLHHAYILTVSRKLNTHQYTSECSMPTCVRTRSSLRSQTSHFSS